MKKDISIVLVEDSKSYAQGMQLLLGQHPRVESVSHTQDFIATLDLLKYKSVDIVILDLNFETKDFDGFTIAKKIRQQYPELKIMILTQHIRRQYYETLFNEYMVDAYLDKQLGVDETYAALDAILDGRRYVDHNILQMLEIEEWMCLSVREREVVGLLEQGLTQKEVADRLYISPKTVEVHIRNLFERFGVKNSTELIAKYVRYRNANREDIEGSLPPFKR